MTEPTRTSTGIAYLTYDATLNTDASMIIQQKLDLSGNTTAQTFCENAFDLAAGEDISGALLADSDITYTDPNSLVYLGSNDLNVQKTFLNNKLNSSIAQNIACNAYEMTLGKNNQIPLVSNLKELQIIYNISTIAGTGDKGFSGDGGAATSAELNDPMGVALDSYGNVYIADTLNSHIRMIDVSDGRISTIAGISSGYSGGYSGDGGAATSAYLNRPSAVVLDSSGNVYIADTNNSVIRMINVSTGIISTIAGKDSGGYSGDGGAATDAEMFYPYGIVLDSSRNLYIADRNNHRIRKVDAINGIISTIAGTGSGGYSGDGGAATSAQLNAPQGVDLDSYGNLYIADKMNHRIRKVDAINGIISTIAGTGSEGSAGDGGPATDASLNRPTGVAFDSNDNIYIADRYNHRIRMVNASTGDISTIAGTGSYGYSGDGGAATLAQLGYPQVVVSDSSGNVYIADKNNNRIRKLTPIYV